MARIVADKSFCFTQSEKSQIRCYFGYLHSCFICHSFCQVKVQTWIDGIEDSEYVGVGARFGTTIVSKEKNANQKRLTLADPRDCCSAPKNKVFVSTLHFNLNVKGIKSRIVQFVKLIP